MQQINKELQDEYDKLVKERIKAIQLLEKIDKQLANLRGKMNGEY